MASAHVLSAGKSCTEAGRSSRGQRTSSRTFNSKSEKPQRTERRRRYLQATVAYIWPTTAKRSRSKCLRFGSVSCLLGAASRPEMALRRSFPFINAHGDKPKTCRLTTDRAASSSKGRVKKRFDNLVRVFSDVGRVVCRGLGRWDRWRLVANSDGLGVVPVWVRVTVGAQGRTAGRALGRVTRVLSCWTRLND